MRLCKAKAVLSLLAAFVVLAVITPGCGGGEPTGVFKQTVGPDGGTMSIEKEIVIRIPAAALPSDATISITPATEDHPAPGELEAARSVGPAFKIDLGGRELSKPVVLEIAFDPDLLPEDSPEDAVFLAFYDEEKKQWVPVYGTVDLVRHVVAVETGHLSWWNPFSWDLSALAARIGRGLESFLAAVGLPVAEIPECGSGPAYMTVEFTDSLLACIEGTENEGQAILRLANNRAYGILVDLRRGVRLSDVSHGSLSDAAWAVLADRLGQDVVYVPPAGEAEFLLRFEQAGEITLSSAPSDITLGLDVLLAILSALGADPDNVVEGVKCLFEIMTAGDGEPPTLGDLLDVAKQCVGVALKGTAGIVWKAIKNLVTLGAATGELLVQRTQELFGGGQGEVTVTYNPPATQRPPTQEPPTPASEVIATKLITVPLEPDQELVGSCWTGSIALPLPHAWRCSSDNRIYDPCLSDSPTDTFVICTGNPFNPLNRVEKLNLTEPLPVSQANRVLTLVVWRLELADGVQCNYILWPTGTLPEDVALMMGAGIKFKCNDGWYVTNLSGGSPAEYIPAPGVWTTSEVRVDPNVWIALKVYWDGYQITEAIEVPITTVWY